MLARIKLINEETKQVLLMDENSNEAWAVQNGFSADTQEVEQSYTGDWYLAGYAPIKPLDVVKAEKTAEINVARDKAEQEGFEFKGNMYDSDPISCQRISMASQSAATALTAGQPFEIIWTTQDNQQVSLTGQDMIEIVPALAIHSNVQHQKASALKEQINNATTNEEVEAIIWH